MSDIQNLQTLGAGSTQYEFNEPDSNLLETFKNQHPQTMYVVPFECFEFSSLCPKTKQPDFATIHINYIPSQLCIESKSLKLYLFSFRNHGEFMEDVTNRIALDIIEKINPLYIEVYSEFNSRGGIFLRPFVNYYAEGCDQSSVDGLLDRFYLAKIGSRL